MLLLSWYIWLLSISGCHNTLHCTTLLVYTIIGMHYYDMYVIRSTYYCMWLHDLTLHCDSMIGFPNHKHCVRNTCMCCAWMHPYPMWHNLILREVHLHCGCCIVHIASHNHGTRKRAPHFTSHCFPKLDDAIQCLVTNFTEIVLWRCLQRLLGDFNESCPMWSCAASRWG